MKIKSVVKTLFWVLFLNCIFQYSLMLPTYVVEQKAQKTATAYAAQFPSDQRETIHQQFVQNYIEAMSDKSILKIPFIADFSYSDLKEQQLQLGLDLKGGIQLGLGINKEVFLYQLVQNSNHANFKKALALTNEKLAPTDPNYMAVFF